MTFRILTVCSGNICRSPLAEQLLRNGLADVEGVSVGSAGTIAMVGERMPPEAAALAARFGATDAAAHRARQLDEQLIRDADLVLALAREHRRFVVETVPAATRTTFTLREFAHLAASVSEADLADIDPAPRGEGVRQCLGAVVAATAALRGVVEPLASVDDLDVIDPYRRGASVYEESAAQLVPAVRSSVDLFRRAAGRTAAGRT
ncbi:low molecular weight phosphatase family protein [Agromyces sp. NPDC056379]|uniref:arsenate reductase/protein-tyrosine-phosphatase family protein n=1 Tax=unclassified Agromyces TaxID=2639701 RepID=UPI0035DF178B